MTLSAIAVPSVAMRDASHGGTRPPWSGRSALPERFTRSFSHRSEVTRRRRCPHRLCWLLVRFHAKRQTDAFADGHARLGYAVGIRLARGSPVVFVNGARETFLLEAALSSACGAVFRGILERHVHLSSAC